MSNIPTLFVDSVNKLVGIGTSEPRSTLDIVGNVWINNGPIESYFGVKAIGGNDVYEVSGYKVHAFTTSGTLTVRTQLSIDILLVGGGGGGGCDNAGGGGAGGVMVEPENVCGLGYVFDPYTNIFYPEHNKNTVENLKHIKKIESFKKRRNILLNSTDKYVTIDYPHVTPEKRQEWLNYRQALRDLPSVTTDPENPSWPTPPTR